MITKHTTKKVTIFKTLAVLPVMGTAVFMFSGRSLALAPVNEPVSASLSTSGVNAADTIPDKPEVIWPGELAGGTKEGVSAEMLKEYQEIVDKYLVAGQRHNTLAMLPEERNRLMTIFKQMSKDQQQRQHIVFGSPLKPLQKNIPGVEQMNSFADPNVYGIWIDDKKVSNETIGSYKNTDISWYMISKLYGAARKGRKYRYQLNLMTNAYFVKHNERLAKNPEGPMLIRSSTKPGH